MCLEDESVVAPSAFPMRERTSPRHPSFDYQSIAAYFVTTCTKDRQCLFGEVRCGRMLLNDVGCIVMEEWKRSEKLRERILLDAWIVMPNHMHGIVCIVPPGTDDISPRGYDLQIGTDPTRSKMLPCRAKGRRARRPYPKEEKDPHWGRPLSLSPLWSEHSSLRPRAESISVERLPKTRFGSHDFTIGSSGMNENGGPGAATSSAIQNTGSRIRTARTHDVNGRRLRSALRLSFYHRLRRRGEVGLQVIE